MYYNDQSSDAPKIRVYLNLDNLLDLRAGSNGPAVDAPDLDARLAADGFEGVQFTSDAPAPVGFILPYCGLDRISIPAEADPIVAKHLARGDQCLTVHAGWGIEDDAEVFRLVEAILKASQKHSLPVFIETHRSTITQDMWRTVAITKEFPEVLFNGDFSHFYCGQEMVYGGMEMKLDFMAPIFERVGFIHGRIASSGGMQVPIDALTGTPRMAHGANDYLAHFRQMWTLAMSGFLRNSGTGDVLIFAPELLSGMYYYARLFPDATGKLIEESDRYIEALLYRDLARECFESARLSISNK
ncbi:MAG: hypothetical protein WCS43_03810 [Verrucomicrobiota bacterium]